MTSSLYWRPTPPPADGEYLGYGLKFVFARHTDGAPGKLWDHDGSLNTEWETLDETWIPFLEGVVACSLGDTKQEALELIEHIKTHGSVQIRIAP